MSGNSFSSLARIGLTVAGSYFGPAGALAGSLIGSALFPPKGPTEPIAPDVQPTNATEGAALPEFFGSCVTNGNVICDGGRRVQTKKKKVGGILGVGGTTVKTRKYFRTYAIGLGKEIGGLRRAWRNGEIVYDRRAQQDGETDAAYAQRLAASAELEEKMTVYLGTADQMPDATLESVLGVGNAPAYRKRSYVVFNDLEETERRGAMSSWKFEVVRQYAVATPTTELAADYLAPWVLDSDPREANQAFSYKYGLVEDLTFNEARDAWLYANNSGLPLEPVYTTANFNVLYGHSIEAPYLWAAYHESNIDRLFLNLHYNRLSPDHPTLSFEGNVANDETPRFCDAFFNLGVDVGSGRFWWSGNGADGETSTLGVYGLFRLVASEDAGGPEPDADEQGANNCTNYPPSGGFFPVGRVIRDAVIRVKRVPDDPPIPGSGFPDWPVNPDEYRWNPETGITYSKEPYSQVAGDYLWLAILEEDVPSNMVLRDPLGPVLHVDDPNNTPEFWLAARNAAVLAGTLSGDVSTYAADGDGDLDTFPRYAGRAWTRSYDAMAFPDNDGEELGTIVRRCSELADLSDAQIDVTDLTEIVRGFQLDQVQTARGAIDTLRRFGFFDVVASGNQIKYPTRGKASVAELDLDDLGAHLYGESAPDKLRAEYVNDQELPKVVRVSYINQDSEYQRGQQLRGRTVTGSSDITDVQVSVVMSDDKAAQIRDVALAEPWIGRETYTAQVGPEWILLEAGDAIVAPLRGDTQRMIITRASGAPGGVQTLELRRDDASIYYPDATGVPSGVGEAVLDQAGDTTLVIIDGPALGAEANDAGVYLAARGEGTRWTGYSLLQSLDGGGEYDEIGDIEGASTMGTITAALPVGPYALWDRANTLEVTLQSGTLESTTEAAVLAGANLAWVGHPDRGWELVQFADATLTGTDVDGNPIYDVSTLLRGRLGTEWAIGNSEAGDYFILAETCERLGLETSEIGVARLFKAVTFGRLEESGPTQTFTPAAVALECFAPTLIEGVRDGSDNLLIYGQRRARISGEWNDSDFVPLNEETEAYEVDVLDGVTVVRTISASSFPIAYSAADQVTDFGSAQSAVDIVIYQLSATVGRGYPTEATV